MTRFFWVVLLCFVLLLALVCGGFHLWKSGGRLYKPTPRQDQSSIDVPSLNARKVVLENGLTLIIKEDRSAPVVSCQMWCQTGSIHEGKWLGAGLSHILEHMLFKGTPTRSNSQIALTIQDQGGYVNAYTSYDRTVYFIDGPSSGWEVFSEVLADAMRNSTLPVEEYDREQNVIRREFAMGYDNPDRMAQLLLFETAYSRHPYRFPVIGHLPVYNRLTREDVLEYYRLKYVPQNLTYVIVGDVDAAKVEEKMRKLLGDWPRQPLPPDVIESEPPQLSRREVHQESNVNNSRLHMAWHIPAITHPDVAALDVLSIIMGDGRSSRFYREIREKRGLVTSIGSFSYTPSHPGLFAVSAELDPDKRRETQAAIVAELQRVIEKGVTEEELSKARRSLVVSQLNNRKTAAGMAAELGSNFFIAQDLDFTAGYLKAVQNVTREDVRRVAETYLRDENLTVVSLNPPGSLAKETQSAAAVENKPIEKVELSNGIRLLIKEDSRLPFVTFRVVGMGGVLVENEENNGIGRLWARTVIKGTRTRTADEINQTVEAAGGSLGAESGNNSLSLSMEVLRNDLHMCFELMGDILSNPVFPDEAVNREREVQLAEIKKEAEQPMAVSRRLLLQNLYGTHPYSLNPNGSNESVSRITRQQLSEYHQKNVLKAPLVISVFGNVSAVEIKKLAEQTWGKLPSSRNSPVLNQAVKPLEKSLLARQNMQKSQAILLFGYPGVDLKSPDRQALELIEEASSDLGSRFFIRIREKMGLAYFVGANQLVGVDPGYLVFYVGTEPGKEGAVQNEMVAEIKRLAAGGLTDEELARAKSKLIGGDKVTNQSLGALAYRVALDELYGLGYDYHKEYETRVKAVTSEQVRATARKYLTTDSYATVIVSPTVPPTPPPAQ